MMRPTVRLIGMTLCLSAIPVAPASAADELGLSVDQIHWTRAITTPLFDDSMRWVPGDSEDATFFVRNQGGSRGLLVVDVVGSSAGDLIDSGDLHITAKGGGGDWTAVSAPGRQRLLTTPSIGVGKVVPISVNVSFDAGSTNQTQVRSSALTFHINLSESVPSAGSGALPDTGAPDLRLYAALSAILVGTGLSFVIRRSRPYREVHDV